MACGMLLLGCRRLNVLELATKDDNSMEVAQLLLDETDEVLESKLGFPVFDVSLMALWCLFLFIMLLLLLLLLQLAAVVSPLPFNTEDLKFDSHCNHFWIWRRWMPYFRAVALWLPLQSPSLRYESRTWSLN